MKGNTSIQHLTGADILAPKPRTIKFAPSYYKNGNILLDRNGGLSIIHRNIHKTTTMEQNKNKEGEASINYFFYALIIITLVWLVWGCSKDTATPAVEEFDFSEINISDFTENRSDTCSMEILHIFNFVKEEDDKAIVRTMPIYSYGEKARHQIAEFYTANYQYRDTILNAYQAEDCELVYWENGSLFAMSRIEIPIEIWEDSLFDPRSYFMVSSFDENWEFLDLQVKINRR